MIVGCYTLDLYCDTPDCPNATCRYAGGGERAPPAQFTAEFGSVCRERARKRGWTLKRDGRAFCPDCTKAGRAD